MERGLSGRAVAQTYKAEHCGGLVTLRRGGGRRTVVRKHFDKRMRLKLGWTDAVIPSLFG